MDLRHAYRHIPKKGSVLYRISRVILFILLGMILSIFLITAYLTIRKDHYASLLLLSVNDKIHGRLQFEGLHFSPFVQFPRISISLSGVGFYQNDNPPGDGLEKPVCQVAELHGTIDMFKLVSRKIFISGIRMEDGQINIIRHSDSTLNVINAFKPKDVVADFSKTQKPSTSIEKPISSDPVLQDTSRFQLDIQNVHFLNMDIHYIDMIHNNESYLDLKNFKADLVLNPDLIITRLKTQISIHKWIITDQFTLRNTDLALNAAMKIYRSDSSIHIDPATVQLGKARFNATGILAYNNVGHVDLQFDGSDEDLSFLSIFLTREGMKNLKAADIYIRGSLEGDLSPGIPNLDCQFGVHDMRLKVPGSGPYIENTKLDGHFTSGSESDLSNAILRIDTLSATLPEGYLFGSFSVKNFKWPHLTYQLDLKTKLSGFDEVFKLANLENLDGSLLLKHQFSGYFQKDSGWIEYDQNLALIELDSLSFQIPGHFDLDHLHGQLSGNLDSLEIHELVIQSRNSDAMIHGSIHGFSQFFKDQNKPIIADIQITSNNFDLAETLPFIPRIDQSFSYPFRNISLDVTATTSVMALTSFNALPKIQFEITHLEGGIEKFLNPINMTQGSITLGESDSIMKLDFDDFNILAFESNLQATLNLQIPPSRNLEMEFEVLAQNLRPGSILYHTPSDSIPNFLYGQMDGKFSGRFFFEKDTASMLRQADLFINTLNYIGAKDTIDVAELTFKMQKEAYKTPRGTNPLSMLNAHIDLGAKMVHSSHFSVEDVAYQIGVENGVYNIIPLKSMFFNKPGAGTLVIAPFADPLWCQLKYRVEDFKIENLLSTFREEPNLSGPMDFQVNMDFTGRNWDEILTSLTADIQVHGRNMKLQGLDIDKFINKFQRSQNFTLVDVGAVIFAGPVGLAVTKGTDFARLMVFNKNESSTITELISEWEIKNGLLEIRDVAFATEENRVAALGRLNVLSDSLDITIGVVNPKGCEFLSQQIYGPLKEPKLGNVKVIAKLFGAMTNIFKDATDCEPFYTGKLKHPEPPKKGKE